MEGSYRRLPEEKQIALEKAIGEILYSQPECPGVCYLQVSGNREYYLVERSAPDISHEAKDWGESVLGCSELLLYDINQIRSGGKIILYEILKYRTKHLLPLPETVTLQDTAVFATEEHPEYFGDYPPPLITPWGCTLRHRRMDSGIFWLETDQCVNLLAVSYPVWKTELSEYALELSAITDYDREKGINSTMGYRFFTQRASCVPLYECLKVRAGWVKKGRINREALMNAIWHCYPEYAVSCNVMEQAGRNDLMLVLLGSSEMEGGADSPKRELLSFSPDAEMDFIHVWE